MSIPTPGSTTPGTFLGREPLLWTAAIRSSLWALVIMEVITLTDVQLGALMIAVEAILYLLTRTQTTPNVSVMERTANGGDVVVAGPANERIPEGAVIRRVGALKPVIDEPQPVRIEVVNQAQPAAAPEGVVETWDGEVVREWPQTDENEHG